ncbi:MAG TPA: helix-turn-helix transcriptional regulator [Candidatus Angelobacter sp.]|nr:helix-turn-helix transcriptional regulator [Candidatus Angelobacter sp.]
MANDIRVRLGRRIRRLREARGWYQIDLAAHSGLTRPYISRLENGRKEVGLKALEKVANAFDMKPWQLLKGL